jgi:molybdenum cofactor cytidylyltransferase
MEIAGVILAAGESRRMGSPKALLPYRGATFLEHLAGLLHGRVSPLLAVLGHEADRIRAGVQLPPEARILLNPDYRLGQLSSLHVAIRALEGAGVAGLLMAPVDHPCVTGEIIDRLLVVFLAETPDVVVPVHGGRRGHPTIFAARLFPELLAAPLEEGARAVVHRHAVREVAVEDPGILVDIDDPDIYRRVIG